MKKTSRIVVLILFDLILIISAYCFSILIRFNVVLDELTLDLFIQTSSIVAFSQLLVFVLSGFYRRVWRYTDISDLLVLIKGATIGVAFSFLILFLINRAEIIPRSVLIIDWFALTVFLAGSRLAYRWSREGRLISDRDGSPTLIVGAGWSGVNLLDSIRKNTELGYRVVGFIDDNPETSRRTILGLPVLGGISDLDYNLSKFGVENLLIADPAIESEELKRLVDLYDTTELHLRILPTLGDILSEKENLDELRPLRIEDIIGRQIVPTNMELAEEFFRNRTVLVTGAGGSIGSELCRQLAKLSPGEIVFLDNSEFFLYSIEQEFIKSFPETNFSCHLVDIRDRARLNELMSSKRPDIVLHAAAYKHVPLLESHAREAIINNIGGTINVTNAALHSGVQDFVLISTDKAVNPANMLGVTKRAAELYCRALQADNSEMKIAIVRFGNVLGSTGSVFSKFENQIDAGGPVTVTHPDMTRYFMSISEAASLVLLAASLSSPDEIFILDMGKAEKILDLARTMIRLKGKTPGKDIEITFSGLRPGEKLNEELFFSNEEILPTRHPKINIAKSTKAHPDLANKLEQLVYYATTNPGSEYSDMLQDLIPEFQPFGNHDRKKIKLH